jgi:hypothetical protein
MENKEFRNENGKLHRLDGPAYEFPTCPENNIWYIDGVSYGRGDLNTHQFLRFLNAIKMFNSRVKNNEIPV